MKLYFFRHANADWPGWTGSDDDRPLTKKGQKQSQRIAKLLHRMGADPALILTSPLPRAAQTAEIAALRLGLELKEEPALAKGFKLSALRAIVARHKGCALMIVGHEPNFSAVIEDLTGGRVKLAKAGVACVELETPQSDGTLLWLISPKCAR